MAPFKYKLIIEYDGTLFSGFQIQKNPKLKTVQGVLQQTLSKIFNLPIKIYGAGRTDTGVHALGQVIHFCSEKEMSPAKIQRALNGLLRQTISVRDAVFADEDFHARHSAKTRHYVYIIDNAPSPSALLVNRAYWVPRRLDVMKMKNAVRLYEGEHDFSRFVKKGKEIANPVRSIDCAALFTSDEIKVTVPKIERGSSVGFSGSASVVPFGESALFPVTPQPAEVSPLAEISRAFLQKEGLIYVYFCGRSFLHSQVRFMAGNLIEIGLGKMTIPNLERMLKVDWTFKSKAENIPGHGLYFLKVDY